MKILFLIPYRPIPRVMKRILTADKLFDVTVVYWDRTSGKKKISLPESIKVHNILIETHDSSPLKRINKIIKFILKANKIIKETSPDVIFTTKSDMLFFLRLSYKKMVKKPKIVYEVSDMHKLSLNKSNNIFLKIIKKTLYYFEKYSISIVDRLTVTSMYFWENYYKNFITKNKVVYLPNVPNPEVFKKSIKKIERRPTIAFIGKVRYVEQLKMLIDLAQIIDINILIAGDGPGISEIEKYVQNLKNIKLYGPYDFEKEIALLYSLADIIYSVYDIEVENVKIALPNRLYEAAYCGLPIIASKGTYLEKIVHLYGLGDSVDPNDPQQLKEVVIELLQKDKKEFIENGHEFTRDNNYKKIEERTITMFKQLINDKE